MFSIIIIICFSCFVKKKDWWSDSDSREVNYCTPWMLQAAELFFFSNLFYPKYNSHTNAFIDDFASFKVANRNSYYEDFIKKLISRLFLTKVPLPKNENKYSLCNYKNRSKMHGLQAHLEVLWSQFSSFPSCSHILFILDTFQIDHLSPFFDFRFLFLFEALNITEK